MTLTPDLPDIATAGARAPGGKGPLGEAVRSRYTLDYRVGTYATFLRQMMEGLRSQTIPDGPNKGETPLAHLNPEAIGDPARALLKAWAVVGDVLAFYQERIATECYFLTATEFHSTLELLRTIGYEPSPGVAAATYLAFTVADTPGSPKKVTVPKGTAVQSVPAQGQKPQTFETSEEIEARPEWNSLKPHRVTVPLLQTIDGSTTKLRLSGTSTHLRAGDRLLLLDGEGSNGGVERKWFSRELKAVNPRPREKYTLVSWDAPPVTDEPVRPLAEPRVFAFRQKASLFGHNAQPWEEAPEKVKLQYGGTRGGGVFHSTDNGDKWDAVNAGLPDADVRVLAINRQGHVFAGTNGDGVFRSTDGGRSWKEINTGLKKKVVNALSVGPHDHIFAGTTEGGVFRSSDNGDQWEAIKGGFLLKHGLRK